MKHICEVSGAEFEMKDKNNIAMDILNKRIDYLSYKIEKLKEHIVELGKPGEIYQPQIDMMEYGYEELLHLREMIKHDGKILVK